jgi:hypothetical protein
MKSKINFSLKFLGINGCLILLIFGLQQLHVVSFETSQFNFILVSSIFILIFSLSIIIPAIGGKKESFVLQFMILTVMQLLFMLSICAYEVYSWGKMASEAVLFQLIPFAWMLISQTILLYRYSVKS